MGKESDGWSMHCFCCEVGAEVIYVYIIATWKHVKKFVILFFVKGGGVIVFLSIYCNGIIGIVLLKLSWFIACP